MDDVLLIGVDGGASKVLAHAVEVLEDPLRFAPRGPIREVSYHSSKHFQAGFRPVPLAEQLAEHGSGRVHQREEERRQEAAFLDSFRTLIRGLGSPPTDRPVVIGIGLPGLKTADRRGISAMANGPRMPGFLDKLEESLVAAGFVTLQPIHALGSDADYCGLGEHWGESGAMRGIRNSYYLGVGTGVADALLLEGVIVPFDAVREWMAKTWEIMFTDRLSYESMVSARGIQARYAERVGLSTEDLTRDEVFPWQIFERALVADEPALEVVRETCRALCGLLLLRLETLASGCDDARLVDRNRRLSKTHPYVGQVFDRIVVGQRLGDMWRHEPFHAILKLPVEETLANLIELSDLPDDVRSHYVTTSGALRSDLIMPSILRNAPALGAAVDAYLHRTE